jgi:uncharacterized membrane protein YdjX (TVP38/TMEM64 family)
MKEEKFSALLAIIGFALSIGAVVYVAKHIVQMEAIISATGVMGPFVSVLLYGILSVTPIPTDPITLVNGALFGPVVGALVSWWGNNLAATLEYFIGRRINDFTNFDRIKKKLPFGLGKLPVNSVWFLLCGRFVPQVGGKVVSLMGGVYKVPLKKYIWTAFLSNLLGSIILAMGGWALLSKLR